MNNRVTITIRVPRSRSGAYSYPTDPDAIQRELSEHLSRWWLASMPRVKITIDGVSAEADDVS